MLPSIEGHCKSNSKAGGGVLKVKLFEEKCEAKPGGERVQKNLPWGSMDIFWNYKITM